MKLAAVCLSFTMIFALFANGQESYRYLSTSAGVYDYEGDEEVSDGFILSGRLGYDYSEMWSIEGVFTLAPDLGVNYATSYGEQVARADFDSTWGAGLAIDGLFHFTRRDRLDPYLALGAGLFYFGEDVDGDALHPAARVGGGVIFHVNDMWAIRADARMLIEGSEADSNSMIDLGLVWGGGASINSGTMWIEGF